MANTILLKRSAVTGNVPTTAQLSLGELAINTYDGKVYIKKDNGTASIIELTQANLANVTGTLAVGNGGTGATTLTGYVKGTGTSALTASSTIPGSDVSGNITGNAANVTGTVAIANGGTGQTSANAALNALLPSQTGNNTKVLTTNGTDTSWTTVSGGGSGTVTSVSVATANGLAGSVATSTTTPAITLSTTVTGVLKGNGTAISAATSGTDYSAGTSALGTGIVKSTTGTGALTIAVAADFPTLNQNTTGTASNVSGTVALANGGTGQTTANAALNALLPSQGAASGLFLTSDGTNTSWAAAGGGGGADLTPNGPIIYQEDFIHTGIKDSNYSGMWTVGPWRFDGGTSSAQINPLTSTSGHPGIVRISSGGNNNQLMVLGGYPNGGTYSAMSFADLDTFIITVRRSTNTYCWMGMSDVTSTSSLSFLTGAMTNFIGFRSGTSTLLCSVVNGGTESSFSTGSFPANTWTTLKVVRNGSGFDFYRDGVYKTTITTNVPTATGSATCGWYSSNQSTTSDFDIDYIGFKSITYSR